MDIFHVINAIQNYAQNAESHIIFISSNFFQKLVNV